MMLQLNPTIDVATPLGDGEAIMVIDYGVNVNTVWVVRLKGGIVKHFYSDDIRVYDNPMNGNGWDVDGFENVKTDNSKVLIADLIARFRVWQREWELYDNKKQTNKLPNIDQFIDEPEDRFLG
jgi:hypothetical protein